MPKALKDIEVLKNFRNERINTPKDTSAINPWDVSYYKSQFSGRPTNNRAYIESLGLE